MKKNRNTRGAIGSLVFAIIFAVAGIFAYTNNYIILLFRVIPLNAVAFGVIAVLLLAWSIFQLVKAPKKDQEEVAAIEQQIQGYQQDVIASAALVSVCGVSVRHVKGSIGLANALDVRLNGYPVGNINNKGSLEFGTNVVDNVLIVINSQNNVTVNFPFTAISGGRVNIEITISGLGVISLAVV